MRDVSRTFQTNPLFKENQIGRDMLRRILLAVSLSSPEVGYCQVSCIFPVLFSLFWFLVFLLLLLTFSSRYILSCSLGNELRWRNFDFMSSFFLFDK
jgi:hypothetical protein